MTIIHPDVNDTENGGYGYIVDIPDDSLVANSMWWHLTGLIDSLNTELSFIDAGDESNKSNPEYQGILFLRDQLEGVATLMERIA